MCIRDRCGGGLVFKFTATGTGSGSIAMHIRPTRAWMGVGEPGVDAEAIVTMVPSSRCDARSAAAAASLRRKEERLRQEAAQRAAEEQRELERLRAQRFLKKVESFEERNLQDSRRREKMGKSLKHTTKHGRRQVTALFRDL